jgi:hypothetical protein
VIFLIAMMACGSVDKPESQPPQDSPLEDTGPTAPIDTGDPLPDLEEGVAFIRADLQPDFEQGNAAWAGVALLDHDGDGLLDIYLTNGESQPNALYKNLGNGRFKDVASMTGTDISMRAGPVTTGDIDNDGDPDLVVGIECSLGTLNEDGSSLGDGSTIVLLNDGTGQFEKQTLTFSDVIESRGYCPVSLDLVDINNDGNLDLSSSNGIDPDQVYPWKFGLTAPEAIDHIALGDGSGGFGELVEISGAVESISFPDYPERCDEGCAPTTFVSAFLDVNGDGRVDRISGEGGRPMQVFLQDEEGQLVYADEMTTSGLGQWMGFATADFDGDGDVDIYSTNQGLSPLVVGYDNIPPAVETTRWVNPFHSMFERDEDGTLNERPDWPIDIKMDQAADSYVPFLDAETGEFVNGEWFPLEGLQRFSWGWGAVALDVDLDGWTDVAFTGNNCAAPMAIIWDEARGAGPGGLLLNDGEGGFVEGIVDWEIPNTDSQGRYQDGRGIATGDLNNDGIADLVFANRSYNPTQSDPLAQEPGTPQVWLSKPRDGHWLRIDLEGTTSNRDAIGAVVTVDLGTHPVVRVLGAGGETNSASERTILVGTGDATSVQVHVQFPGGTVVSLSDVAVDQAITVVEP